MESFNGKFNASKVGQFFKLEERGSNFTTEFRGAVATFLTMAYILAVNPRILADSGGSCDASSLGGPFSDEYADCKEDFKRQLILSTAMTSMVACFLMGTLSNLPIALSCGMGMNAYFTFDVVGYHGTNGNLTYGAALSAVLIEGLIFFLLAVTGVRYYIIKLIPEPVRVATPAAIGAFLAHLGLQTAEGIGVVVGDIATGLTLGGCPEDKRTPLAAYTDECKVDGIGFCNTSDNYTCDVKWGKMTSGTTWIGIFGTVVMVILLSYKVRSSMIICIGFVTFISWFRATEVTFFPDTDGGNNRFDYFKKIVSVESLEMVTNKYDFSELKGTQAAIATITMLYIDFLDTSGTLLGLVSSMNLVDENGDFPQSREAFSVDAISTVFGSIFGLSPVTSYIESAAGIEVGSRTGLTSVFISFFFFVSMFFAPIISSIPPWACGGALIVIGALMSRCLNKVHWENPVHACVAFITIMIMPLTYSIAYGLIAGIGSWIAVQAVFVPLEYFFDIPNPSTIKDESTVNPEGTQVIEEGADSKTKDLKNEDDDDTDEKEDVETPQV